MKLFNLCKPLAVAGSLALLLNVGLFTPSAHANVYATNIKLGGSPASATVNQGSKLSIFSVSTTAAATG